MPGFPLNKRSIAELEGVHPVLVVVTNRAAEITEQPFQLSDGVRTVAQQEKYLASGASKTFHSCHLTGHAVDAFATRPDGSGAFWQRPLYIPIAEAMKTAAKELGFDGHIEWGGDWGWDAPHFQLKRDLYPFNQNPNLPEHILTEVSAAILKRDADQNIAYGDAGREVRALQIMLKRALGTTLLIDGLFGMATRNAVMEFQRRSGLPASGVMHAPDLKTLRTQYGV
jgi:peptidoglycan L-alanyl-D-glutamate endopeptidase CwlK